MIYSNNLSLVAHKNIPAESRQIRYDVKFGGIESLEIKIVGSIADKDEVHIIKNITEVFLIERRIRNLLDEDE